MWAAEGAANVHLVASPMGMSHEGEPEPHVVEAKDRNAADILSAIVRGASQAT